MNKNFGLGALLFFLGTLAAACGGNVVVDGSGSGVGGNGTGGNGAGGNGMTTNTYANKCQEYADKLIEKLEQCGVTVTDTGTGGVPPCSDADGALAACFEACLPLYDCACATDPTGSGCQDKLQAYADCANACVK